MSRRKKEEEEKANHDCLIGTHREAYLGAFVAVMVKEFQCHGTAESHSNRTK